jgi:hypothetical protein
MSSAVSFKKTTSDVPLLTASVKSTAYCRGDNDIFIAHLTLAMQYKNISRHKMIFYRPEKPVDIMSAEIAANPSSLEHKQYEAVIQYDEFIEPPRLPSEVSLRSDRFRVVLPEESYEIPAAISVPVRYRSDIPLPGTVASGSHAISLSFSSWPFFAADGKRLQEKWLKTAELQYEPIRVAPFEVAFPKDPDTVDCFMEAGKTGDRNGAYRR